MNRLKADVLLFIVALIWAASYGSTKLALAHISVLLFIAIRFGISALLVLPWCIKPLRQTSLRALGWAVISGILLAGIFICEVTGVKYTSAANAAVLISLCVLFTPVIERIALAEELPVNIFACSFIAVIGCLLLVSQQGFQWQFNLGDGLIVLAALLRAGLSVLAKKLINNAGVPSLLLTGVQFSTVALLATTALAVFPKGQFMALNAELFGTLAFLILACTLLAFSLINFALKHSSASRVVFITGTEPLFAVLFSLLIFEESLNSLQLVGAGLIIISTYWLLASPLQAGNGFKRMPLHRIKRLRS